MNDFPSHIHSVRLQHFITVLFEQHLSRKFLSECIDEAIRRENGIVNISQQQATNHSAKELARRLS